MLLSTAWAQTSAPAGAMNLQLALLFALVILLVIISVLSIRKRNRRRNRKAHSDLNSSSSALKQPVVENPKGAVFISYRRRGSDEMTGRIYDRLVQHFGSGVIFKDVDSIPLGVDFRAHLDMALSECKVALAIIGRSWLDIRDESGIRRLDNSSDHLRVEIETALQRNIPIVPVLIQGATMPTESDLPSAMKSLAFRNGIAVRNDPDFHNDMDRLIKGIEAQL